jgi:hypothetical protein
VVSIAVGKHHHGQTHVRQELVHPVGTGVSDPVTRVDKKRVSLRRKADDAKTLTDIDNPHVEIRRFYRLQATKVTVVALLNLQASHDGRGRRLDITFPFEPPYDDYVLCWRNRPGFIWTHRMGGRARGEKQARRHGAAKQQSHGDSPQEAR